MILHHNTYKVPGALLWAGVHDFCTLLEEMYLHFSDRDVIANTERHIHIIPHNGIYVPSGYTPLGAPRDKPNQAVSGQCVADAAQESGDVPIRPLEKLTKRVATNSKYFVARGSTIIPSIWSQENLGAQFWRGLVHKSNLLAVRTSDHVRVSRLLYELRVRHARTFRITNTFFIYFIVTLILRLNSSARRGFYSHGWSGQAQVTGVSSLPLPLLPVLVSPFTKHRVHSASFTLFTFFTLVEFHRILRMLTLSRAFRSSFLTPKKILIMRTRAREYTLQWDLNWTHYLDANSGEIHPPLYSIGKADCYCYVTPV